MHSFSVILVARLGCLCGVTDVNDAKRDMILGHLKDGLEIILNSLLRICAAPYCTKTKVCRTKKNILYCSRAILNPVFGNGRRESATSVASYNYNKR